MLFSPSSNTKNNNTIILYWTPPVRPYDDDWKPVKMDMKKIRKKIRKKHRAPKTKVKKPWANVDLYRLRHLQEQAEEEKQRAKNWRNFWKQQKEQLIQRHETILVQQAQMQAQQANQQIQAKNANVTQDVTWISNDVNATDSNLSGNNETQQLDSEEEDEDDPDDNQSAQENIT
ncbi:expressed unknown protein [Seminavis robusta]|uniref:Uncharacterized protein n=1 Tax=Seminavis robusta TaxID=568900 RepID=A0A9N8HBZ6_9STRA|nr:expressed unknown protein [Seminavis robusta]|eukprot:Sro279_g106700.1 n/a (174) ;mRNA; r:11436-11957